MEDEMETLDCPASPTQDDNLPNQPSVHQELIMMDDSDFSLSMTDENSANNDQEMSENAVEASGDNEAIPKALSVLIPSDLFSNLADLSPGVTAELRRILEETKKRDMLISQIRNMMDWESLNAELKALLPEEFLSTLASWVISKIQPEAVRTLLVDQNRKEQEFLKKRDDLVQEHQKEISAMKKRHKEAIEECDHKNLPHRKPLIVKKNEEEFQKLLTRHKDDLVSLDKKIVLAFDSLLTVQQRKFQEIGVPGMKETSDPTDILQQMLVIDVVAKLAGVDLDQRTAV